MARQLAAVMLDGTSVTQAAKQLGLPLATARRIVKTDGFKFLVSKVGEDELGPALAKAKSKLAKLTDKAVRVIENQLDQDNLEAAKMVLRAVGLEKQEEKQEQDTLIQVVLPGVSEPKTIIQE